MDITNWSIDLYNIYVDKEKRKVISCMKIPAQKAGILFIF